MIDEASSEPIGSKERKRFLAKELVRLQAELVKWQETVRTEGRRVVAVFEGRDAAGKGGVIKRILEPLNRSKHIAIARMHGVRPWSASGYLGARRASSQRLSSAHPHRRSVHLRRRVDDVLTAGRNGWVDGVRYQAVSFSIEGTFTPTGGDPQPVNESKVWGGGKDLGNSDAITCTADVSEVSEEGVFEAELEVIAVPA